MQFGRVHGRVGSHADCPPGMIMLEVVLETSREATIIRRECVSRRLIDADVDLQWLADQYTQETIGHDLMARGWEAIAQGTGDDDQRAATASATVTYVVRRV